MTYCIQSELVYRSLAIHINLYPEVLFIPSIHCQGLAIEDVQSSEGEDEGEDEEVEGEEPNVPGRTKPPKKGPGGAKKEKKEKKLKLPELEKYERPSLAAKKYCDMLSQRLEALKKLAYRYEQGKGQDGVSQVDKVLCDKKLGCIRAGMNHILSPCIT